MTRKKKSRSLKRIHSVKTGNASKLKRAGTTDRQSTNLKDKNKPKSVYQKFLEKNPDAAEKQTQPAAKKATNTTTDTTIKDPVKDSVKKGGKLSDRKTKPDASKQDVSKEKRIKDSRESRPEKEPDLLSQLDNKNFNDFY